MSYIDYTGRYLKLKDGSYSKIVKYDSNGYAKDSAGREYDLHYCNQPLALKHNKGEVIMPENWNEGKSTDYELY